MLITFPKRNFISFLKIYLHKSSSHCHGSPSAEKAILNFCLLLLLHFCLSGSQDWAEFIIPDVFSACGKLGSVGELCLFGKNTSISSLGSFQGCSLDLNTGGDLRVRDKGVFGDIYSFNKYLYVSYLPGTLQSHKNITVIKTARIPNLIEFVS